MLQVKIGDYTRRGTETRYLTRYGGGFLSTSELCLISLIWRFQGCVHVLVKDAQDYHFFKKWFRERTKEEVKFEDRNKDRKKA